MKEYNGMRANYFQVITVIVIVLLSPYNSCAQSGNAHKIKNSFLQTIKVELMSLQEWGMSSKDNPEKALQHWEHDNSWHTYYSNWKIYSYDISATNSIVSPYVGIVTLESQKWTKVGITKDDCLRAPWRPTSGTLPTLKYLYQYDEWVLIYRPHAYKKY
jgi:hypothetical protein